MSNAKAVYEFERRFNMKSRNLMWGLFFVAAAAVVVLSKAGVIGGFGLWTLLMSLVMVPVLVNSIVGGSITGTLFSVAIYAILYSEPLGIQKYTPWTVLVVAALLSIGLNMIFPKRPKIKTKHKKNDPANWETSSLDGEYVYIKAKYTGSVKYVTSQNLKAADIESTFAGLKVYLDNAQLANGYATVNIDASFGGVELYIPKEWTVVNDVTCTFAGSEEKGARGFQSYQNGDNTIVLKGNAKFSGISIYRV